MVYGFVGVLLGGEWYDVIQVYQVQVGMNIDQIVQVGRYVYGVVGVVVGIQQGQVGGDGGVGVGG